MEGLYESFDASFHVTLDENDISLLHPRYTQYKQKFNKNSQEERRKTWLATQKERRADVLNAQRDLSLIEELDVKANKGSNVSKLSQKTSKNYKDVLMLSEWLVDIPEDLDDNWIVKLCPEGKRVLVVAQKGKSTAYGRNGHPVISFNSSLPGSTTGTSNTTLLDCVWSAHTKTFYVLDVIFWGCLLQNCEAEFRFFWLHNKLEENPELCVASRKNRYRFEEVAICNDLKSRVSIHPHFKDNKPKLDGILFYHKESLYASGKRSPLVSWLKPFMLSTILSIPVSPEYLKEIPPQYQKMEVSEPSDGCGSGMDHVSGSDVADVSTANQNCEEMS